MNANIQNTILVFSDQSQIIYSIPDTPLFTNDEVEFWLIKGNEKILICKDSFNEIVSRADYVFDKAITSIKKIDELDEIAELYSKTFMSQHSPDVEFDRYILFDGIGYTTWISQIDHQFYIRIDHIKGHKKHTNIVGGFVDKSIFLSWWNRVKQEIQIMST